MSSLSRRALLTGGLLAGGLATLTTSCASGFPSLSEPRAPGGCRTPDSLAEFSTLGGATLGYEVGRTLTTYKADPRFIELLEAWAEDWSAMSGLGAMTTIWSYGAFVDKCSSFHAAGRAFDIAEVEHANGSVSCRHDVWGPGTATQVRNYWRLAASLHLHFGYTLTHLYNQAHDNHIHVDNATSAWEPTTFSTTSRVQVQMVQAACKRVFGADVDVNGTWDAKTRDALRPIQASLGITRPMGDAEGWREFLRATASAV